MIGAAANPSAMLPSALRPIPMHARGDLVVERIDYQGQRSFVIKDPVGLKYHRLRPEQFHVLELLDDTRSLEDLRDQLHIAFPAQHLQLTDVQSLVSDLHKQGLVHTVRPGQGGAVLGKARLARRKKIKQTFTNFLFLRLPGWDPERTLSVLLPWVRWMFHPLAVLLACLLVAAAWITLAINFDAFHRALPAFDQFFSWPNVLYMWITLALCKITHEFGHGLTCRYFGRECHEMGLMFLVFSPCLYCDVTDSWMLRSKWQRIAIAAAGMAIEVVLSAIAIFVWLFSGDGLLRMIALNVFFVTTITTVIFNLNPLMRFDGYYMLSDFLEIPNLRQKADKLLREKFGWYCLGIEPKHDPFMPETGIAWFVTYAIASWAYKWFIMFGIAMFLYTWLKPYQLQSIGATLAACAIGGAVISPGVALYRMVSAPRVEPLSKPKIAVSSALLAVVLAAACLVPLPMHVEAPFLIEPAGAQTIYVATPGRLESIHIEPLQRVEAGDLLAVLSNRQIEDRLQSLTAEQQTQSERLRAFSQAGDEASVVTIGKRLDGLSSQIADMKGRLAELRITAPSAGTILAPDRQRDPEQAGAGGVLPDWTGTPLDPENAGAYLETGTRLAVLAPANSHQQVEATLYIEQAERNDVFVGQMVELRFDHLPRELVPARVENVAARHVEYVPAALAAKNGGPFPTVTDQQGRERLQSHAYQASVLIDGAGHSMLPGMRGLARLEARSRSAAGWAWRYLRQTFYFRL